MSAGSASRGKRKRSEDDVDGPAGPAGDALNYQIGSIVRVKMHHFVYVERDQKGEEKKKE